MITPPSHLPVNSYVHVNIDRQRVAQCNEQRRVYNGRQGSAGGGRRVPGWGY